MPKKLNTAARTITATMSGVCIANCTPSRIAPTKRSLGSELARLLRFQRRKRVATSKDIAA